MALETKLTDPVSWFNLTRIVAVIKDTLVSFVGDSGSVNLDDYAKKSDLDDYAKTTDLADYAKSSDLADYAKTTDLADYAKTADLGNVSTVTVPTTDPGTAGAIWLDGTTLKASQGV